jgi:hypothetical protein
MRYPSVDARQASLDAPFEKDQASGHTSRRHACARSISGLPYRLTSRGVLNELLSYVGGDNSPHDNHLSRPHHKASQDAALERDPRFSNAAAPAETGQV